MQINTGTMLYISIRYAAIILIFVGSLQLFQVSGHPLVSLRTSTSSFMTKSPPNTGVGTSDTNDQNYSNFELLQV